MTTHTCDDGGYVVGAEILLPTDPAEYKTGPLVMGCNHLVCQDCGATVRSLAGVQCADLPSHLATLAETADWSTLPIFTPFGPGRVYACRCRGWLDVSLHACGDPYPDPTAGDPDLPWRCGGHPVAQLPALVDGAAIGSPSDVERVVKQGLGGHSPKDAPKPCPWAPTHWVYRLRRYFADTDLAEEFGPAVAANIDDPKLRAGVIAYFCGFPRDPGFERVLVLGTDREQLWHRWPTNVPEGEPSWYWPALAMRSRLFSVRGTPDALDLVTAQLLQDALLRGDEGFEPQDLDGLAHAVPTWVADNAVAIAAAQPKLADHVLESLEGRDRPDLIEAAGVALARSAARDVAAQWIDHGSRRREPYVAAIRAALQEPT